MELPDELERVSLEIETDTGIWRPVGYMHDGRWRVESGELARQYGRVVAWRRIGQAKPREVAETIYGKVEIGAGFDLGGEA